MSRIRPRTVMRSLAVFAAACLALAPAAAAADEDKRAEYGTVIGIGACRAACSWPSS